MRRRSLGAGHLEIICRGEVATGLVGSAVVDAISAQPLQLSEPEARRLTRRSILPVWQRDENATICVFWRGARRSFPFRRRLMPAYRSRTTTHGRNMAGARGLWRATGMKDGDFGKPIIAVANSFTQFVPGHVHLKDLGQLVAREIEAAGGVAKEFNTIAVDDGIAMGHDGMLYSLPSRELIADSVEYMVNAHCADALVCISNCDKITPGMLMAAMRLNIPAVFVSGGPMEAGKVKLSTGAAQGRPDRRDGRPPRTRR